MNRGVRREMAFLTGLASAACLLSGRMKWAKALGAGALGLGLWPSLTYSFRNRAVVITGSSRGLGLALAEQFLRQGARVALIARDSTELDRAQELLQQRVTGQVFTLSCDVTKPEEMTRAFERVEGVFGQIDILVNNAGSIVIGPFESMERVDYEALMNLQVHAIVHATQAALPMLRQAQGRIVNICSIGGKIAVPHMSTYCAAKFALAGLSATMAAELAADGVTVTTVFPGLMRVGSPVQAVIKGDHDREYAWFALGDILPGMSVSARHAARTILSGVRAGDSEVVFPTTAKLAVAAQANFPELFALAMRTAARFFPRGQSFERRTGAESKGWLENQKWYAYFEPAMTAAQEENNQKEHANAAFNLGL